MLETLFKRPLAVVVEPLPTVDRESVALIPLLNENPGFKALMGVLRFEKARMESVLRHAKHSSIREVDELQAGIRAFEFLEKYVNERVTRTTRGPRHTLIQEADETDRIRNLIDSVGSQKPE